MSRIRIALPALLLLFGATAASAQLVPGAPTTDWERARADYTTNTLRDYNALITGWGTALGEGDARSAAAHYTDAAVLLFGSTQAVKGRAAIRDYFVEVAGQLVEIRTGLTDFAASDHLAYATGPAIYTYRDANTRATHTVLGNHVTVLFREGRRWRIRSQVLSFEDPAG